MMTLLEQLRNKENEEAECTPDNWILCKDVCDNNY